MYSNVLKRIAPMVAGCLALCASAPDPKLLSPSELEQARRYLDQARSNVADATKGLSEAQWKFKPAPERWSIAEIVEHMVLAQELVLGPVREQLAAAAPGATDRDNKRIDALVMSQMPDRSSKFQAPDFLKPTGRWTGPAALERLYKNCDRLAEYLESAPDLRRHVLDAPPLKAVSNGTFDTMDGYQWILAAAAHVERHTRQIREVKADPGFPSL